MTANGCSTGRRNVDRNRAKILFGFRRPSLSVYAVHTSDYSEMLVSAIGRGKAQAPF